MKVKASNDHMNSYGANPEKKAGDIYDVPDDHAAVLIAAGHCAEATEDDIKAAAKAAASAPAPAPVSAKPDGAKG